VFLIQTIENNECASEVLQALITADWAPGGGTYRPDTFPRLELYLNNGSEEGQPVAEAVYLIPPEPHIAKCHPHFDTVVRGHNAGTVEAVREESRAQADTQIDEQSGRSDARSYQRVVAPKSPEHGGAPHVPALLGDLDAILPHPQIIPDVGDVRVSLRQGVLLTGR